MAYYKKFTPDNKKSADSFGRPAGEKSFGRGGYQGRTSGSKERSDTYSPMRGRDEQPRRFGPAGQVPAQNGDASGRAEDTRRQGHFAKPGFDRRDGDRAPSSSRGYQGRPAAPGFRQAGPGPRTTGPGQRPLQPARQFGRPAAPSAPAPAQPYGRPAVPASPSRPAPARQYGRPALPQDNAPQPEQLMSSDGLPENLLSGRNPIREALKAGRDIEKLLVACGELSGSAREILAMAKDAGIIVQTVDRSRLDQITHNHQGMIAYASAYSYSSLEDILAVAKEKNEAPFIIVLDKITDPMNLGAIIRTAACVGAHGVLVQLHRAVGLTPSAVRASAGAVEHIKVARVVNINNSIRSLKQAGIWVYAADTQGTDYRKVKFDGPCALVIGSEGEGVSALTLSLCDEKLSIPMSGVIDSLNASVAAGILMYAAYSGRNA